MIRPLGLLLFCFISFFRVNAQVHGVGLVNEKLKKPITKIKVEEILDLRPDKTKLGWVQVGVSNQVIPADFIGPFPDELLGFITSNSKPAPDAIPVILKVNKLQISERTLPNKENCFVEIDLEILAKKDGNLFKIAELATIRDAWSIDVTDLHDENIARAFREFFDELEGINLKARLEAAQPLSAFEVNQNTYYHIQTAIIPAFTDSLKQGVYRTFREFKQNRPGITQKLKMQRNGKMYYDISGISLRDVWGFTDHRGSFIYFGNEYFPLINKGKYYAFTAPVTVVDQNAVLVGALMGGIIGGAVAGALTSETTFQEFIVNMKTGSITKAKEYGPVYDLAKIAKVVLYRAGRGEQEQPVEIYNQDSLIARLTPNSSVELTFKVPVSELKLCMKGAEQTCLPFTPVLERYSYIACSVPEKKNKKPELKVVTAKEANYYLKLMEAAARQKDKAAEAQESKRF